MDNVINNLIEALEGYDDECLFYEHDEELLEVCPNEIGWKFLGHIDCLAIVDGIEEIKQLRKEGERYKQKNEKLKEELERVKRCYESATGKGVCGESDIARVECRQMSDLREENEELKREKAEVEAIVTGMGDIICGNRVNHKQNIPKDDCIYCLIDKYRKENDELKMQVEELEDDGMHEKGCCYPVKCTCGYIDAITR